MTTLGSTVLSEQDSESEVSGDLRIFYQILGGKERWLSAPAEQRAEIISVYKPRYMTVLSTSLRVAEGEKVSREASTNARYSGGFYADLDGDVGDLKPVIGKANQFLDELERDGVDLQTIRLYCSGGRGFHAEIPAECFMLKVPVEGVTRLPAIYWEMAYSRFVDTMDMNVYSSSRGRQWRVPNIQRENGNYKVPITPEEMRAMTPESYATLVSAPREIPARSTPSFSPALGILFANAVTTVTTAHARRRKKHSSGGSSQRQATAGDPDNGATTNAVREIRRVADAALDHIDMLLPSWLPDGYWEGSNFVALNPRREDKNPGSFKIHMDGYWIDYAQEAHKGGDLVALRRFLDGDAYNMVEAARRVAEEIGLIDPGTGSGGSFPTPVSGQMPVPGQVSGQMPAPVSGRAKGEPIIGNVMDLLAENFPPIRWVVEGVLPEGLSLLAGSPKTGKSWMVLEMAIAVASGGTCLGGRKAMPGDALYLALEDNKRRLQERINLILAGGKFSLPENMSFALEWPRLDQGGVEALDHWLSEHPDARLVVIDTLAKMRKKQPGNSNLYAEDYAVGEGLKQLSDKYHVAVVLVTHVRKAESQDPLEMVTGTLGLVGGMDGILVLKRERGQGSASLYVTGRDVPEDQYYGLTWDKDCCRWAITGTAGDLQMSEARKEVLAVLGRERRPLSAKEIAELTKRKLDATRKLLPEMLEDGLIEQVKDGQRRLYVHPLFSGTTPPPKSPSRPAAATPPTTTTPPSTTTPPTLPTTTTTTTTTTTVGVLGRARDAHRAREQLRETPGGSVQGVSGTSDVNGASGVSDVNGGNSGSSGSSGNSVRSGNHG